MVRSFFAKEEGQGGADYAATLAVIAIVVIVLLTILGRCSADKTSQAGS